MSNKFYMLETIYYPSGKLHMGHCRVSAIGDVITRFKKAMGYEVIHPMGADAFGLPAENAAINNALHPAKWTYSNVEKMNNQFKSLGTIYDWDLTITTCDSEYYKYEQKMFIDFFNNGIAYQKESIVNWDPVDQTVLANEQVENGRGWRSGALVEQKRLKQWFLNISKYSQELLDAIPSLNWPEKIKKAQENWIGKSEGAEIDFSIENNEKITVFSTRPETLFGCTFLAIAPDHEFAIKIAKNNTEVNDFIEKEKKSSTKTEDLDKKEKEGIFTDKYAIHPITQEKIPIWIANFVLSDYGTGAVFGCPGHDERDFEFAKKYDLDIIDLNHYIKFENFLTDINISKMITGYDLEKKQINIRCDTDEIWKLYFWIKTNFFEKYDLSIQQSFFIENRKYFNLNELKKEYLKNVKFSEYQKINFDDLSKNIQKICKKIIKYKLRDWGISRQRYWGCPISIVYCKKCGIVPEKEENLPITLPQDVVFDGKGNPLANHPTWKNCKCPKCGIDAIRETDTLDTFFESSWYFLKYLSADNKIPLDINLIEQNMPVDVYVCGAEHAVSHLLYSRFFMRALRDCNYFKNNPNLSIEPFKKLIVQGIVCHKTYKTLDGKWIYPELVRQDGEKFFHIGTNEEIIEGDAIKMSKSKNNIVEPNPLIEKYGVDAMRLFILSDSPIEKNFEWSNNGIQAIAKFLTKIKNFYTEFFKNNAEIKNAIISEEILSFMNRKIYNYLEHMEKYEMNVAIAKLREFFNFIISFDKNDQNIKSSSLILSLKNFLIMLNPFCPLISDELYRLYFNNSPIQSEKMPTPEEKYLKYEMVKIAVQFNGRTRGIISIKIDAEQSEIEEKIKKDSSLFKYLEGKKYEIKAFQKNKIISFVIF